MSEKKMVRESRELNSQDACKAGEYGELNVVNIRLVKEPSIISEEPVRCSDDASRLIRDLMSGFDREVCVVLNLKKEISELQRILNFIEKVIDYGLPDMNADDLSSDGMTMAEMAGIFSERI